jgi:RND family efflux transporter MFP subunit
MNIRLLALSLGLVACHVAEPATDPDPTLPLPPRVSAPTPDPEHVGVIVAEQAIELTARVDGRLVDVRGRPGDRVRAGDIIASIDTPGLLTEVDAATAALEVARAEAERVRLDASHTRETSARTDELRAYVSAQETSTARYQEKHADARHRRARADVLAAEARVQAEQRRADAELRAPFDGVVAARYADPGAAVSTTAPIVRLIAADNPRVRFAVPEMDAAALTPGDGVQVRVDGFTTTVMATVETVAPEVDAAAGLVFVEARFSDGVTAGQVPLGVMVRVRLAQ